MTGAGAPEAKPSRMNASGLLRPWQVLGDLHELVAPCRSPPSTGPALPAGIESPSVRAPPPAPAWRTEASIRASRAPSNAAGRVIGSTGGSPGDATRGILWTASPGMTAMAGSASPSAPPTLTVSCALSCGGSCQGRLGPFDGGGGGPAPVPVHDPDPACLARRPPEPMDDRSASPPGGFRWHRGAVRAAAAVRGLPGAAWGRGPVFEGRSRTIRVLPLVEPRSFPFGLVHAKSDLRSRRLPRPHRPWVSSPGVGRTLIKG